MEYDNTVTLHMAAFSHTGLVREKNQDNLYFLGRYLEEDNAGSGKLLKGTRSTKNPLLTGVFDGMGGHVLGERAAFLTAEETARTAGDHLPDQPEDLKSVLEQICLTANEKICREIEQVHGKMGTTASFLCFTHRDVLSCNVGDSPIFLIRDGSLEPMYTEHTERRMKEEIYGPEKVKGKKFPLTQHIGISPEEMLIEPSFDRRAVCPGDRYLICSDGLTDLVEEAELLRLIQEPGTAAESVKKLARAALHAGGKDNITIILMQAEDSAVV